MSVKEGYKQTEVGVIPEDWDISTIQERFKSIQGSYIKPEDMIKNGQYYIYGANGIIGRYNQFMYEDPTVLVSCRGANCGVVHYTHPKSWINNNSIALIKNDSKINEKFIYYYFSMVGFIKEISGSAQPQIIISTLNKKKIPLPPLKEQKKIAEILSTVDQKIAFVDNQIEETELLKKGLMQKLLTEGIGHTEFKDSELGRIPESWKITTLGDIFNVFVGRDLKENSFSKIKTGTHIYPVFSNTVDNNGFYGFYNFEEFSGDSLTVVGRGIGVGTAFTKKGGFGAIGRLLVLFPNKKIEPHFYTEYINFKIKIFSESSGIPQLTGTKIKKYKCPFPPIEEQKKIAKILSTIDEKLENLKNKKESLEELKKGLMQKLLTGEVRI